jgi:hypothetical protein
VFRWRAADLTDLLGPERGFDGPADTPEQRGQAMLVLSRLPESSCPRTATRPGSSRSTRLTPRVTNRATATHSSGPGCGGPSWRRPQGQGRHRVRICRCRRIVTRSRTGRGRYIPGRRLPRGCCCRLQLPVAVRFVFCAAPERSNRCRPADSRGVSCVTDSVPAAGQAGARVRREGRP